jgi:hypothetical protein
MAASTVPRYNDRYQQRWVGTYSTMKKMTPIIIIIIIFPNHLSMVGKNFNKNAFSSGFSTNKDRGCKQVYNDFPTSFLTMG